MLPPSGTSAPRLDLLREQRYRKHFLREDRRQVTFMLASVVIPFTLSLGNDFALLPVGFVLWLAVAARTLLVLCTLGALFVLQRAQWPRQHDRIVNFALIEITLLMSASHLTRIVTGKFVGVLIATTILVGFLYLIIRGPIVPRAVAGAIVSIATFILPLYAVPPLEAPALRTIGISLIVLNVVGILSARSFEQNRRIRFEAERRERHALQELAIQKERAEALSNARAAFVASMSHEFRTPMNAVIGLSDLLLDAPLANEHWRHVRTINESARALLGLLNDILDFAKIDAQKIDLSTTPFDLHLLASSVVEMLRPQAETKSLDLRFDVSHDVPQHFIGDDSRLRQVLVNLVSNAVKFTDQGTVTLEIAGQSTSAGKHELTFRVTDTGIGMAPDVMTRLFRPFEQADVGIARRHGGSGLGLAISKQIIQAMGGDIRVESNPGRGSVFSFSIRLEEGASANPVEAPALDEQRAPLVILVVDDNEINRDVARARLGRLGYRVDLASSGPSAIEAVSNKEYDVVFMDLRMPEMSGIEATTRIMEKLEGPRQPHIIAMTASVFEEDREACRRAGMRAFVGKPIDLGQIDAVLRRVAAERGTSAPREVQSAASGQISMGKLRELHPLGNAQFFVNLCKLFLGELDKRLPRMTEALNRHDARTLEDDAHLLKSTSAALGALDMAELCARIETAAHADRIEEVPTILDALWAERRSVEQFFSREMKTMQPALGDVS